MEIIAEVGSTWVRRRPNEAKAAVKKSIEVAARCGATIVKFQLFTADTLYSKERAPEQWQITKDNELPLEWLPMIREEANLRKVKLWASVFNKDLATEAAPFLDGIKIASGDVTNLSLIRYAVRVADQFGIDFGLSTGAAEADEIISAIQNVFVINKDPVIFHCVSAYPAKAEWLNLAVGRGIRDVKYGIRLGLSDHTLSNIPAMIAVGMGYTVFEKHFMLSGTPHSCGDRVVSLYPDRFQKYVNSIRKAEKIVGSETRKVHPNEMNERVWARRGSDGLRPANNAQGTQGISKGF